MIIEFNQPSSDNLGHSLLSVLNALTLLSSEYQDGDAIEFNISNIDFVHPLLILPLAALYNKLLDANIDVKLTRSKCQDYLNTIYFPKGFNPIEIENWQEELKRYESKSYLPICKIPSGQYNNREAIRDQLISNFSKILSEKLKISNALWSAISYLVSEMIDNIINHANVDYGWIMFQNYTTMRYLDICILDNGVGLLDSYRINGMTQISTHRQALEEALNGLSTKHYEGNRGYGIVTSRKLLADGLNGTFFMFSGDAAYVKSPLTESLLQFKPSEKWSGTLIALRIPKDLRNGFNLYDYVD